MKLTPGMTVRLASGTELTNIQRVGHRTTKFVGYLPTGRGYFFTKEAVEDAAFPNEWAAKQLEARLLSGEKSCPQN